jgi:hypothetical protein
MQSIPPPPTSPLHTSIYSTACNGSPRARKGFCGVWSPLLCPRMQLLTCNQSMACLACSIKTKNWSARFIRRRCENCYVKAPPCKFLRVVRRACRYAYCFMFRDCVSSRSCGTPSIARAHAAPRMPSDKRRRQQQALAHDPADTTERNNSVVIFRFSFQNTPSISRHRFVFTLLLNVRPVERRHYTTAAR